MRHIISVLMQNEAGALARLVGLFSSRGFNIESLSVAPTHDDSVSRLTLVTVGNDAVVDQITKQLSKLIDVVEVLDLSERDHIECELALVKVEVNADNARRVVECVRRYRGFILDESEDTRTIQISGSGPEVSEFITEMAALARILEVVRSGVAAMEPGARVLALPSVAAA